MKALIFGISGQDGFYLEKILRKNNIQTIGVSRSKGDWIAGDVSNYGFVSALIKEHSPDFIFHLAANSSTRHSTMFENHLTICNGTLNILESVNLFSRKSKVFISGSALQFVNEGRPINEKDDFEARDVYSVSRIQSVFAARYFRTIGLNVYIGYFFNHDSPLRGERHVNQKIISAARRIANGSSETLRLGDISVKKEFGFAGDAAEAIWILVNSENVHEAVIGNGSAYSIGDWLNICFGKFGLDWKKYVEIDSDFIPEYKILVSDPSTILNLGWKPKINIHELADLMSLTDGK